MASAIPGYEVGELLGYGSHAQVWSGRHRASGDLVALKRLPVGSVSAARAARFEAGLLTALEHPSLILLREYLAIESEVVLVLELAEGGSLSDLLARRGRLAPSEVVATISPVAAAVAHAHEQGVLHGDISAANVLFTAAGQPKLADLGVARLIGAESAAVGTPAYADPVVAAGGAPGAASDVFALAAVALHALSGSPPWSVPGSSHSADDTLALAAGGEIVDLAERLAGCPTAIAAAVTRALDPEPFRRGTAAELALDLRAALTPSSPALSAGRATPRVGRHAVDRAAVSESETCAAEPGRPNFTRPGSARLDAVPDDLTHASRPRVRPVAPAATGRRAQWAHRWRRSRRALLATGCCVAFVAAATALVDARSGRGRIVATPGAPPTGGPRSMVQLPAEPGADLGANEVAAVLIQLDKLRAAAFAHRRPDQLRSVYVSPELRRQDERLLATASPAGCRVTGLRTTFARVEVLAQGTGWFTARTTMSQPAAQIRCPDEVRALTRPSGPAALTVTVVRTDPGRFAIASQQMATS
jgi:hypothetical protein